MKILALGDPHGFLPKNIDKIIKKNGIDAIVCVGDWGFTPKKPWIEKSWKGLSKNYAATSAKKILKELDSYNIPFLSLKGNMFLSKKGNKLISPQLKKLKNFIKRYTGKAKLFENTFIFFDIIYENSTIRKDLNKSSVTKRKMESNDFRKMKLNSLLRENKNSILITHNPPYGVVDKSYNGEHVGSKIIANAIKKYNPKLVLCGHIHEAKGKAKIGRTPVYNLGERGDYAVFNIVKNKIKLVESNFLK